MLSKNRIKYIRSFAQKRVRDNENLFIAEGNKLVSDLLKSSMQPRLICATTGFIDQIQIKKRTGEWIECSHEEIRKASLLKNPQEALALFEIPQCNLSVASLFDKLTLVLDCIQDPGNMGTIIRMADWFGIEHIICSKDTVDLYNPKVVQASMGAISRVKVHYTNLPSTLTEIQKSGIPVYGTTLDGENLYSCKPEIPAVIVMGNEGKGISGAVAEVLSHRLYIPNYPPGTSFSESLNVAIATAVVCAEFRRLRH